MMIFFQYLVEVSVCIIALYMVYHFFLQQEKLFKLNRSYLLMALIAAFAIPCINVGLPQSAPAYLDINPFGNDLIYYYAGSEPIQDQGIEWTWQHVLMSVYGLGVLAMLGSFLGCCIKILFLIQSGVVHQETNYHLVLIQEKLPVFSFLNYVFLYKNHDYSEKEKAVILAHEATHIRERHTLDILLIEGCKMLLWFNPVMYLYQRKLKEVHEYLADAAVVESACTTVQYATLMMQEARKHTAHVLPMTHFFHNQIKNRLIMLSKIKQPNRGFKIFLSLPVVLMLFLTFSINGKLFSQDKTPTEPTSMEKVATPKKETDTKPVWKKVDDKWELSEESNVAATKKIATPKKETDIKTVWKKVNDVWVLKEDPKIAAIEKPLPEAPSVGSCYCLTDKETNTWQEVVCIHDMKKELLDQVNNALKSKDYTVDPTLIPNADGDGRFKLSETTMTALHQYQVDKDIHVGPLTMETIKLLGLTVKKIKLGKYSDNFEF